MFELFSYGGIDEEAWTAAVSYLKSRLPPEQRQTIAHEIEQTGIAAWVSAHQFPFGLQIRNLLRQGGFDEGRLGVVDLDSVWGHLLNSVITDCGG